MRDIPHLLPFGRALCNVSERWVRRSLFMRSVTLSPSWAAGDAEELSVGRKELIMTTAQTTQVRIGGFKRHPMIEGMAIGALVAALAVAFLAIRGPDESVTRVPAVGEYTLTKVLQAERIGAAEPSVIAAAAAVPQLSYGELKVEQAKTIGGAVTALGPSAYTITKLEQTKGLGGQQSAPTLNPGTRNKLEQVRELP